MKMKSLLNESDQLSNPMSMGGFVIRVDTKNGTVYLFDKSTKMDGAVPGNELIKLGAKYVEFLGKLSKQKRTI